MSASVFADKTKRKTSTSSPLFELSYTRKGSITGEVNNTLVEVQPSHALVGFMGSVCAYAEYDKGEHVQMYSIWAIPRMFDEFCETVSGRSDISFQDFQSRTYTCHHCRMDTREESLLEEPDDYKLKKTFKLLFEKTVYEYVREQRLEKAFDFLEISVIRNSIHDNPGKA